MPPGATSVSVLTASSSTRIREPAMVRFLQTDTQEILGSSRIQKDANLRSIKAYKSVQLGQTLPSD